MDGCNEIAAVGGVTLVSMAAEIASEIDMGVQRTHYTRQKGQLGRRIKGGLMYAHTTPVA